MELEQIKQDTVLNPQMTPSLKRCWGWKRFSSLAFYLGDNVFLLGKDMLMKIPPPNYNLEAIGIWPEIRSYENSPSKASYTHVYVCGLTF